MQIRISSPRTSTWSWGFRFEWNGTPTEGADRFVEFNLTTAQLQRVHKPYNENYNYEPRVGFTWDPYKDGKTIVRGAYGLNADQPTANAVTGLAGNPPFATGVSYQQRHGALARGQHLHRRRCQLARSLQHSA